MPEGCGGRGGCGVCSQWPYHMNLKIWPTAALCAHTFSWGLGNFSEMPAAQLGLHSLSANSPGHPRVHPASKWLWGPPFIRYREEFSTEEAGNGGIRSRWASLSRLRPICTKKSQDRVRCLLTLYLIHLFHALCSLFSHHPVTLHVEAHREDRATVPTEPR